MSWCSPLPSRRVPRQLLTLAVGALALLASACNSSALPASPTTGASSGTAGAAQPKVNRLVFSVAKIGRAHV